MANKTGYAYFGIKPSDITSKFQAQGGQAIKCLFLSARACQPSLVFIDELESLCSSRGGDGANEDSDQIKVEVMTQIQEAEDGVLIIGATNLPSAIESAVMSRLSTQIHIPLPNHETRQGQIRLLLDGDCAVVDRHSLTDDGIAVVVEAFDGYSGRDIKNVLNDAAGSVAVEAGIEGLRYARPLSLNDITEILRECPSTAEEEDIRACEEFSQKNKKSRGGGGKMVKSVEMDDTPLMVHAPLPEIVSGIAPPATPKKSRPSNPTAIASDAKVSSGSLIQPSSNPTAIASDATDVLSRPSPQGTQGTAHQVHDDVLWAGQPLPAEHDAVQGRQGHDASAPEARL